MCICDNLINPHEFIKYSPERTLRVTVGVTKVSRILSFFNAFEFKGPTEIHAWSNDISFLSGVGGNIHVPSGTSERGAAHLSSLAFLFFPSL